MFAEGYHLGHLDRLARRWDKAGAGGFIDIVGARDTCYAVRSPARQRMLFADTRGFG